MTKNFYQEPWLSIEEQIKFLQDKGCKIGNKKNAETWLKGIGMSRVEGYLNSCLDSDGRYCEGVTIEHIMNLYMWDKRLKSILIDGCRSAELSIRTSIAHSMGKPKAENDRQFAHLCPLSYRSSKFSEVASNIQKHERRARKGDPEGIDPAIFYLKTRYKTCTRKEPCPACVHKKNSQCGIPIPVWISIEHWTLETIKLVYSEMNEELRSMTATNIGLDDPEKVDQLISAVIQIRNRAAHHARMYNRKFRNPILTEGKEMRDLYSFIRVLIVALRVIPKETISHKKWEWLLYDHILKFPKMPKPLRERMGIEHMGIFEGWRKEIPWKGYKSKFILFRAFRRIFERELFDCR